MTAATLRPRFAGRRPTALYGFVGLATLIVAWELWTIVANVPTYILPKPSEIVGALVSEASEIAPEAARTIAAALGGLLFGPVAAIITAVLVQRSRAFEYAVMPFTLVLQSVPIVAMTPVLALMFGRTFLTAVVVASMICYFPVLVNMVRGLRSVSEEHVQLFHVLASNESQELRMLRLPSSVPHVFAGLRAAGALCLPGALIAEWVTSRFGLGPYIINQVVLKQSDNVWAGIVVSTLLTVVIFSAVVFVERFALRWSGAASR
jgi:NitT/TauT family transport system permease protein